MFKFALVLLFSCNLIAGMGNEVCVIIDQAGTGNDIYPNRARLKSKPRKSFNVYHMKEACFNLDDEYFMQHVRGEAQNSAVYATRCFYKPKIEDEGKLLRFEGYSGSSPCPVNDTYTIDR